MRIVVIASCLLAGCAGAPAEKQPISTIGIDHMVIPAVPEVGGPVAAYAGFDNRGSEDRLLGIDCTCAASVELHQVIRNGGQVSMTNTFPLALPMGRTEVKPPGVPLHFMLIGTNRAFSAGQRHRFVDTAPGGRVRRELGSQVAHQRRHLAVIETVAKAGHVRLNRARLAKPSHDVRPGDVLTIVLNARVRVLRVLALAERRGAATAARSLYSEPGAPAADAPAMSETGGGAPQKEDASEDGNC